MKDESTQHQFIIESLQSLILCKIRDKNKPNSNLWHLKPNSNNFLRILTYLFKPFNIDKLRKKSINIVSTILNKQYMTGADMQAVFCLFQTLFMLISKDKQMGLYYINKQIQEWVIKLDKLNVNSSHGFVYITTIFSPKIQVIIKVPREENGFSSMLREYFIGIKAINNLRYHIPTFVYTLGAFLCPLPNNTGILPLTSLCKSQQNLSNKLTFFNIFNDSKFIPSKYKSNTAFVIYEKIPGASLDYLLKNNKINFENWLLVFIQVLLSLEFAQREIRFTHFDLHTGNVMVREDQNVNYIIPLDMFTCEIKNNNFLPVIIDFGTSSVFIDGKNIGSFEFFHYGILNFCIPGYDMYKLLIYSYLSTNDSNLKNEIRKIFQFYGPDDPYNIYNTGDSGANMAQSEYCARITFSKAATYIPLMLLSWLNMKYKSLLHKYLVIKNREIYIPLQYSNMSNEYDKIFNNPNKGSNQLIKLIEDCLKFKNSYILSSYIIHIIYKYNIILESSKLTNKIKVLEDNLTRFSEVLINLDNDKLNKVFLIKLPKQEELNQIRINVLNIPIQLDNFKHKENVTKLLYIILDYQFKLQPYLQFYFTILEVNIRDKFSYWIKKFIKSKQFIFYTENISENIRVLRWAKDTLLSSNIIK